MKTAECVEGYQRPKTFSSKGYGVTSYRVCENNVVALSKVVTGLYIDIFHRDPEISRTVVEANISHGVDANEGDTIVMLARDLSTPKHDPVGFAVLSRLVFSERSVLYISRGLLPAHEGKGVGRFFVKKGVEELRPVDMVAFKTQNPASIWSVRQTGLIDKLYPFDATYDTDRAAQNVLLELSRHVRRFPSGLSFVTGLSTSELIEEGMNLAYKPHYDHDPTMNLLRKMVYEFGMNRERGDTIYVVGEVKPVAKDTPLDSFLLNVA